MFSTSTASVSIVDGQVNLTIGPVGEQTSVDELAERISGSQGDRREFLFQQVAARLHREGVDLNDHGAVKACIEGGTYLV